MRASRWYSSGVVCLLLAGVAEADCPQLLDNNEFSLSTTSIAPWVIETPGNFATVSAAISNDTYALLLTVQAYPGAPYESDAMLSQPVSVVAGQQYRLTFWARGETWSGGAVPVTVKVGQSVDPYTVYGLRSSVSLTYNAGSGNNYSLTFTANTTDANAGLVFMFGENNADLAFDSIFLEHISSPACPATGTGGSAGAGTGGAATGGAGGSSGAVTGGAAATGGTRATPITGALIRANQVGYIPLAEKVATVKHASTTALDWQLIDASSNVLTSGVTRSMASDPISGDYVHLADFGGYTSTGTALRLRVGNATSPAFRVGGDVFGALRRDALRFFYHQRASTAIGQPYAEGAQWVRSAGHADTSVPCRSGSGCSYSLNVSKGWYDAGDFGKYVVNGGISAWTLMHLYERTLHLGTAASAFGDSTSNIPESGNGIPDLLDEIRWEMEFMLGMQVPAGQTLAGMAHHKVHGTKWPAIPIAPASDTTTGRVLSAPSTAATLNLAATAAQCARVFASFDAPFATRCRAAAEAAFAAAEANPARYAVNTPNGGGDDDGGGAYDDATVTDEFYWAAAELFATTGSPKYLDALLASTHHKKVGSVGAPFSWQSTAAAGALTLAVVPSNLSASALNDVRRAVVEAADAYHVIASTAYGTAIQSYGWGSNGDVLNAAIVLAVAYDITGSVNYRRSALGALDYVLGRNPLGKSYVTGYGTAPFQNAHHRFFAHGFNSTWPTPPPGVMAGGPNQNLDGLEIPGTLSGCIGPKCWTDDAAAYGLTEITINWNAPLAWVAAWASEQETHPKTAFPGIIGAGGASGAGGAGAAGSPNVANQGGAGNALGGAGNAVGGNGQPPEGSSGGSQAITGAQAGNASVVAQQGGATGLVAQTTTNPNAGGIGAITAGSNAPGVGAMPAAAAGAGPGGDAGRSDDNGGCGCRVANTRHSSGAWLALVALSLLLRRKRH